MSSNPDALRKVSSLYGRVYRYDAAGVISAASFLPIREGVSLTVGLIKNYLEFPPYTGGCIAVLYRYCYIFRVSSLYGRVYR